jgi:DNA integrity scanning protein DisA with diadenylate cyclase activity
MTAEEFAADVSEHTMIFAVHLVKEDGRVTITVNGAQVGETTLLERYQDF